MKRIVLATRNEAKSAELQRMLADLPLEVRTLRDYPQVPPLPEEGGTYEANARSKALAVARWLNEVALADDSGLEVDYLEGQPGARSARFLGDDATDEDRNREILRRLEGVPPENRTARYRAVVAVAFPDGRVHTFEGTCEGAIALEPRGTGGFGYDPIFYLPELDRTVAELNPQEKDLISHRGQAVRKAREFLLTLVREQRDP
ncbi:MAG: XTP/dITP diphosphatase [Armatimonadota bacterium]|nr:XTP/dITP diphosphatase [Armatimonadota bacterium]MDR5676045.1 XTP/dITP diphosphatase [Armatimonadota bacterium]MDR5688778.1 XTP/dITP diphosphatase [Armatimonadota bacterium]MDR7385901.1 XTP/dITP diphosphatase [Armatimonadota bacterium]MDR7390383.1 XTP/dITP diphosphatase [Armatimonadota bacterium]